MGQSAIRVSASCAGRNPRWRCLPRTCSSKAPLGHPHCVLAKGAIEDYYPAGVTSSGPKPDRALLAAESITAREQALRISKPLNDGRASELEEILVVLFRGL